MLLHARRWNRHHHRLKTQGYASFILMVCSNGVQKLAASITRSRRGSRYPNPGVQSRSN
jgi:hypothetical protein